jgi:hypothetical protein
MTEVHNGALPRGKKTHCHKCACSSWRNRGSSRRRPWRPRMAALQLEVASCFAHRDNLIYTSGSTGVGMLKGYREDRFSVAHRLGRPMR